MKTWLSKNLESIAISIVAFFSPIIPLMLTVGFLVAVDFIFGIWRSLKLKQEVTSRKMSHTITKILLYNVTIMSVWVLEKNIIGSDIPITKIVAGVICLTETKSIDEAFKIIFGFSIWSKMKRSLGRGESLTK